MNSSNSTTRSLFRIAIVNVLHKYIVKHVPILSKYKKIIMYWIVVLYQYLNNRTNIESYSILNFNIMKLSIESVNNVLSQYLDICNVLSNTYWLNTRNRAWSINYLLTQYRRKMRYWRTLLASTYGFRCTKGTFTNSTVPFIVYYWNCTT